MTQNGTQLPEYNGYNNKFSWLVGLWLDNDYGLHNLVSEWADEVEDKDQLAEQVKDFVDEQNPLAEQASMYSDILSYALVFVDYESVVDGYWEERTQDEDEDD